jgi:DMSO/TMAO reductase YedYZ molybdopterin-dependent catalytic subunit
LPIGFALLVVAVAVAKGLLGFKQVKWIKGIEFVAHYSEIGGGYGGYNQDHEFFGYRQSI